MSWNLCSYVGILNDKDSNCNSGSNRNGSWAATAESWFKRNFAHLTLMKLATPLHSSSGSSMLNIHASGPLSPASGNPQWSLSPFVLCAGTIRFPWYSSTVVFWVPAGRTSCSPTKHFYISDNKPLSKKLQYLSLLYLFTLRKCLQRTCLQSFSNKCQTFNKRYELSIWL